MKIVDYLLSKGADINAKTNFGWTALYLAASEGNHLFISVHLNVFVWFYTQMWNRMLILPNTMPEVFTTSI